MHILLSGTDGSGTNGVCGMWVRLDARMVDAVPTRSYRRKTCAFSTQRIHDSSRFYVDRVFVASVLSMLPALYVEWGVVRFL